MSQALKNITGKESV